MRAIEISQPGPADVLRLCERPVPEFKAGEVLIKVHAAGINRPDVFQRLGSYAPPPGASDLPGLEVAGEIIDGDLAGSRFSKGDLDGRISIKFSGRQIDFRASAQPTTHGENLVLRVLGRQIDFRASAQPTTHGENLVL
eukprot:gene19859-22572_t